MLEVYASDDKGRMTAEMSPACRRQIEFFEEISIPEASHSVFVPGARDESAQIELQQQQTLVATEVPPLFRFSYRMKPIL